MYTIFEAVLWNVKRSFNGHLTSKCWCRNKFMILSQNLEISPIWSLFGWASHPIAPYDISIWQQTLWQVTIGFRLHTVVRIRKEVRLQVQGVFIFRITLDVCLFLATTAAHPSGCLHPGGSPYPLQLSWHCWNRLKGFVKNIQWVRWQFWKDLVTIKTGFGDNLKRIWWQFWKGRVTILKKFGQNSNWIWWQFDNDLVTILKGFGDNFGNIWSHFIVDLATILPPDGIAL